MEAAAVKETERVEAIKQSVVGWVRSYFNPETMSPSQIIAAVLLQKIMATTGLNELGHEIVNNLEQCIIENQNLHGEDAEEIYFWRGLMLGVDYATYLI